jgi:hypothetical protein
MSAIRRIARNVAKANMKKAGMVQICKKDRHNGTRSYFGVCWRKYAKK